MANIDVKVDLTAEAVVSGDKAIAERGSFGAAALKKVILGTAAGQDSTAFDGMTAFSTSSSAAVSLALADHRKFLRFTHAAPTLTVPLQATVAFPDDFLCWGSFEDGGTITIPAGGTINGVGTASLAIGSESVNAGFTLRRIATNTWILATCGLAVADMIALLEEGAAGGDAADLAAALIDAVPKATLDEYLTGTSNSKLALVDVQRYMGLARTKSYAATLTITLDGARTVDGDDHDSDSLPTKVIDVSNDCDIRFSDIHAGLEGAAWSVRLVSTSAAAHDITVSTANGITVELAPDVTIPAMGSSVGDALEILGVIVSATKVRVERTILDAA
jgi:hypothetical protein